MNIIIFWALITAVAVPLALLRSVYDEDRRDALDRVNGHEPPRSHPRDEFSRTGSTWH